MASLRHVEVVARVLGSAAAERLAPEVWAGAETQLAAWIPDCTPNEVHARGVQLIDALDADGPEPDDRPEPLVNELYLHRDPDGIGGTIKGSYQDAAMFDAIATLIDTTAKPVTPGTVRAQCGEVGGRPARTVGEPHAGASLNRVLRQLPATPTAHDTSS